MSEKQQVLRPASPVQEIIMKSDADVTIIGGSAGCIDADTEFLSQSGWKRIADYTECDLVMQVDLENNDTGSLVKPLEYIKKPCEEFYHIKTDRGIDQMLSEEHTVYYKSAKTDKWKSKSAKEYVEHHYSTKLGFRDNFIPIYKHQGHSLGLSPEVIRLYVALKADGNLATESTGRYRVNLKKERKKVRLRELLKSANYSYEESVKDNGYSSFVLYAPDCSKTLADWMFCSEEDAKVIIDEIGFWDGYYLVKGNRIPPYFTTDKKEADAVQYFYNICGFKASIWVDDRKGQDYKTGGKTYERKSITYEVSPTKQVKLNLSRKEGRFIDIPKVKSKDGYKYCFTLPSGAFIARRNGNTFITGNSGKSYLLQLMALKYIDCPKAQIMMTRRTTPQIVGQGGIWDTAKGIYRALPKQLQPRIREKALEAIFPTGAKIKFQHMEHEEQSKLNMQGLQFTFVGVD